MAIFHNFCQIARFSIRSRPNPDFATPHHPDDVAIENYEEICGKYEGIRGKYEEISGEYEGICETYEEILNVENMKKYMALGIRRTKRGASRHINLCPHIKALGASPLVQALGLRRAKQRAKRGASRCAYLPPYIKALGLGKVSSSPLCRL